jgi:hypothetical protein
MRKRQLFPFDGRVVKENFNLGNFHMEDAESRV